MDDLNIYFLVCLSLFLFFFCNTAANEAKGNPNHFKHGSLVTSISLVQPILLFSYMFIIAIFQLSSERR